MKKYFTFISPVIFIICFILIFTLKAIPNGKLWNNYSVLYVPSETDDSLVRKAFVESEITDYVSLYEQYLPLTLSENSIEIAMLKINYDTEDYDYLKKRSSFFFDKSNKYRLYYIPKEYKNRLADVVNTLSSQKIESGVDSTSAYPWIIPAAGLIILVLLSFYSKKQNLFIFAGILPLLYLYSNPFYPNALSFCLLLLVILFITNVWKRKNFIYYLILKNPTPALLFLSLLSAFSSSIKSGLIFLLCLTGIVSAIYTFYYVEEYLRNKKSFIPVFIKPAKMINVFAKKSKKILIISCSSAVFFIALFFITQTSSLTSHFAKLLLPSSTDFGSDKLPQLEEYYDWTWKVKTYPYLSLNENTENPSKISYSTFTEEDGKIIESKVSMIYDQNYKQETYNEIDNLQFESVEKVLKSQGNDIKTGYSSTSNYHINIFGIIMMFICLFVLLFIFISIMIRKGEKNDIK